MIKFLKDFWKSPGRFETPPSPNRDIIVEYMGTDKLELVDVLAKMIKELNSVKK